MPNRFFQYAGVFVGALLAWCRLGTAATGAAVLDLRTEVRPGSLSSQQPDQLSGDNETVDAFPAPMTGDPGEPLAQATAVPILRLELIPGSQVTGAQQGFTSLQVQAFVERLNSGPPQMSL